MRDYYYLMIQEKEARLKRSEDKLKARKKQYDECEVEEEELEG